MATGVDRRPGRGARPAVPRRSGRPGSTRLLGTDLAGIGDGRAAPAHRHRGGPWPAGDGDPLVAVTVPTFRPDIRTGLEGEADIAEEVARTYGYARLPRRTPAWPQPGRLTDDPARPPEAEGGAGRAGRRRGVDPRLPLRGRPAGRGRGPALRRGDQPAGRVGALPAGLDGARAAAGAPLQRRPAQPDDHVLRGGRRLPAVRDAARGRPPARRTRSSG